MSDIPPIVSRSYFDRNKAVRLCLENDLRLPALVLIYSGIDAWAWLGRPVDKASVTRADFIEWVERYMLKEGVLHCNATDLYGARCAVLHSVTAESTLSERAEARWIWYSWGDANDSVLQTSIDKMVDVAAVAVHLNTLFEVFVRAGNQFLNHVAADDELRELVTIRATKYFKDFVAS